MSARLKLHLHHHPCIGRPRQHHHLSFSLHHLHLLPQSPTHRYHHPPETHHHHQQLLPNLPIVSVIVRTNQLWTSSGAASASSASSSSSLCASSFSSSSSFPLCWRRRRSYRWRNPSAPQCSSNVPW